MNHPFRTEDACNFCLHRFLNVILSAQTLDVSPAENNHPTRIMFIVYNHIYCSYETFVLSRLNRFITYRLKYQISIC